MPGGQAAVAAATAAVFVDGRRAGSAVLVAPRYLVTAAHVLLRLDPGTGAKVSADQVELEFPGRGLGGQADKANASRLDLGPASVGVDVAVLDLGEDLPGGLPTPVPVWPAARVPGRVKVFGYPLAEGPLNGVWRQFAVAGPDTAGTVQLDWMGEAGTFPGHSGGPVIDGDGHALAGILVEGSKQGRFDRFVPVTLIAQVWPRLPRPWLITGPDPGEARSHFTRRACGQGSTARGGDLFRGRQAALAAVRNWLTAEAPPGQALVITGQPGAGKSAVLSRAALSLEAEQGGPGLAFHARGAIHDDLLTAVADLTGAEHPETREALLDELEDAPAGHPMMIVVDALDEAASGPARRQIAETLIELAVVPRFRVAVATRPLAAGNRYLPGELLPALGVTSAETQALVDLDTDRYFEPDGLRQFAAAMLTQHQARYPNPADAAWASYRADPALRDRLAEVIAARAHRNYLVAAMAALRLSAAEQPVDPAAMGFDPARIPARVGEALAKYLDELPGPQQSRTRALLTALAYSRGSGIDDRTWTAFTSALGYPVSTADLDQLRASTASDYLLQAITDDDGPLTRLFHQALADELLARRHQPSDERALLSALRPAPGASWATASSYALRHAADHASTVRQLLSVLDDPHYLAHADLVRLPSLISLDADTAADPIAVVVRQVASRANPLTPPRRARLLALTASHFGLPDMMRRLASVCTQAFTPLWAHSLGTPHTELASRLSFVKAVAIGRIGDRDVIVCGCDDGTVRVWDAATGRPRGDPLTGHTGYVNTVAIGRIGDRDVIVSGGHDKTVQVWDAATGRPCGGPLTGHTSYVRAVAIGRIGDRDVIVSGGYDGAVRVWDAATGRPHGDPLTGHTGDVQAVAIGRIGDRDVIVSGGYDGAVRVWDAATGRPRGDPLTGHTSYVHAVAIGRIGDRDVIVSGGDDGAVRIWDAATGRPRGDPLTGHTGPVYAVAIGPVGDRDVIVSGGDDGAVRVWDAATGRPRGDPLTGHTSYVNAVAIGRIGDRDVIVSGGEDETVRIWDAATGRPRGDPLTGHTGPVYAVAIGPVGDRDVIVSGGYDGAVRIWDAATGRSRGDPLTGHTGYVNTVAIGPVGDRDVIVSGGYDGAVRVWDAATGRPAATR